MGDVFELPAGRVEMELLDGVLHLTESGTLRDLDEVARYIAKVETWIERTGSRRGLIDARAEEGDPPAEVREAMWEWLAGQSPTGFTKVGFVLSGEMSVARVNMLALARGAEVRAFDSLFAAQRWLMATRRRRTTSNFRSPSSRPPPLESAEMSVDEARRTSSTQNLRASPVSSPGAYSMRPGREEAVGAEGRGAEGRGADGRGADGRGADGRGADGRGAAPRSAWPKALDNEPVAPRRASHGSGERESTPGAERSAAERLRARRGDD